MSNTKAKQLALSVLANSSLSAPAGSAKAQGKKKRKNKKRQVGIVQAPAAYGQVSRTNFPKFQGSSSDGRIIVTHREYVCDVNGVNALQVTSLPLNPGLGSSFPWISQIAERFESYLFRSLRFVYEPSVGSNTVGAVILAVDYDAADSAPDDKQTLMGYHGAVKSSAWSPFVMSCDRPDLQKFGIQRYLRYDVTMTPAEVHAYDVGTLYIGAYGFDSAVLAGELFVEYTVELITPQMQTRLDGSMHSASVNGSDNVTRAKPFGDAPVKQGGLAVEVSNGKMLTFREIGDYLLEMTVTGTGISTGETFPIAETSNMTVTKLDQVINGAFDAGMYLATISVDAVPANATIDFTLAATAIANSHLRLSPYRAVFS